MRITNIVILNNYFDNNLYNNIQKQSPELFCKKCVLRTTLDDYF